MWGSKSSAGRRMKAESPLEERRGREHRLREAMPQRWSAVGLGGVDVERKHLVAQHPARGAVGQSHAKPVGAGGALEDREHLTPAGQVDGSVREPRAGVYGSLLGQDPDQRVLVVRPGHAPRGPPTRHHEAGDHEGCPEPGGRGDRGRHGEAATHVSSSTPSGPSGGKSWPPPCVLSPAGRVNSSLPRALLQVSCWVTER